MLCVYTYMYIYIYVYMYVRTTCSVVLLKYDTHNALAYYTAILYRLWLEHYMRPTTSGAKSRIILDPNG